MIHLSKLYPEMPLDMMESDFENFYTPGALCEVPPSADIKKRAPPPLLIATLHSAFLSVKKVTVKSEYTRHSGVEWALICHKNQKS